MTVLENFYKGDKRALSKIISYIEDRREGYRELLGKLYSKSGNAIRIGVTGPPGAGKSTLVNALLHRFLKEKKKVGVIAVDPSSPFTGGALLGDRVRMNEFPLDGDIYFRSMATRGASGGLAASTNNVLVALDAFGFDVTIVETVGVGQVELDIIDACDSVVVALVPDSGDAVQTMKAGLMEIADVFVVNKADRPNSDRIVTDLRTALEFKAHDENTWMIPVIPTVAVEKKNIEELYNKIFEHIAFIKANKQYEAHRRLQIEKKIIAILRSRFEKEFVSNLSEIVNLDNIIEEISLGNTNPYTVGKELYEKFHKL